MIKTLGDSVLFLAEDADSAMAIAEGLIEVIGHDARLPDVRIGLATGTVVTRMGDVFGPPVNLAARLTALARRNRVITDDATVERPAGRRVRDDAGSPPARCGGSAWSSRWPSGGADRATDRQHGAGRRPSDRTE